MSFANPLFEGIVAAINDRLDEPLDPDILAGMIRTVGEDDLWHEHVGPMLDRISERLGLETPVDRLQARFGVGRERAEARLSDYLNAEPDDKEFPIVLSDGGNTIEALESGLRYLLKKGWEL